MLNPALLWRRAVDRIRRRDPEHDAARRAVRAALVLPLAAATGFALGSGSQTPLFAIFGSVALLITVDFPGNRPARALAYPLAVSVAVAFGLGAGGGLAQTPDPSPSAAAGATGKPCSSLQLVGNGLDLCTPFLPAARSGAGSCELTATAAGDALTVIRWTGAIRLIRR
jgi:hypothetical protein